MELKPKLSGKAEQDYELVQAALGHGDQKAYAALVDRYRDSLYTMLSKMTQSDADAEDMMIEAFGKAFNNLHHYSSDYAFSTWLFRIATNNCIDFLRKQKREGQPFQSALLKDDRLAFETFVADCASDPELMLVREQNIETLRVVVDKLKPHYKILVEMRYYKEYSYEEIAQELNIPLGTVKAKLFRAKEFLYNILKNTEVYS